MRFTSLIVELIRVRPALMFWVAVLAQAMLWFIVPTLLYSSPPGDLAINLAYGREYMMGSAQEPPLAFWLSDIAFRLAGKHIFGVYLLSQVCFVIAFWAVFRLGRAIVGAQHAVVAVLLTATITAFAFPQIEFGPHILAQPLWALTLLSAWRVFGEGKRSGWFALSIHAGLLLLASNAALPLLGLLGVFVLATARGRRMLASLDAVFALLVVAVLVLPYAVFLYRTGVSVPIPDVSVMQGWLWRWSDYAGRLLVALAGVALLAIVNSKRLNSDEERAPVVWRPPVDPLARSFVFFFAVAPALLFSLASALLDTSSLLAGSGTVLLMAGLAVVVAAGDLIHFRRQRFLRTLWLWIVAAPAIFVIAMTFAQPWIVATEVRTLLPARAIGEFFGDAFQRRTGQPLRSVTGDPQLATLISFAAPERPRLLLDASPEKTPWLTLEKFKQTGGVIVWRAADTAGTLPEDIARRFPGLVPEVPRSFQRYLNGRQPLLRIGWAIVRPEPVSSAK
jgi:4-amino-4-deoxy-L-arabinose transferase-like glycosyltransferase